MKMPHQVNDIAMAAKVTSVRLLTVALTVWLVQRYAFFRRSAGEPPRFFAYTVNGAAAAAASAAICLFFHLDDADALSSLYQQDRPLIALSFLLCTAIALCCDDWVDDAEPPFWWPFAEAVGCAMVMAFGMVMVVIYMPDALPFSPGSLEGLRLALLIAMPSGLALVLGGLVPHIYRSARHAASARRDEANQSFPVPA